MSDKDWQPSASLQMLKARADLLSTVRAFMADKNILEVETPVLCSAAVTDPNLESLTTQLHHPARTAPQSFYLHTSPEYAMKRLLVAGSGPIYQIVHVFRDDEAGRLHNPEFTMLEWYRPGFDHHQLMDELDQLLQMLSFKTAHKQTYASAFSSAVGVDPHTAEIPALQQLAIKHGLSSPLENRSALLDFIFSHCIADKLGHEQPEFIYDYPACQAALSRITNTQPPVAERFELFINGMEIANGFHELTDAAEQRARFHQDNEQRRLSGKPVHALDERFLAALEQGLPSCAGVALGLDRLLMAITGSQDIRQMMAFTIDRI